METQKILLVEDDAVIRQTAKKALQGLFRVEVRDFATAEGALGVFKSGEFTLLITDLELPGMNGDTLIETIGGEVASILMSANGKNFEDGDWTNLPACMGFLSKPFSVEELKKKRSAC